MVNTPVGERTDKSAKARKGAAGGLLQTLRYARRTSSLAASSVMVAL